MTGLSNNTQRNYTAEIITKALQSNLVVPRRIPKFVTFNLVLKTYLAACYGCACLAFSDASMMTHAYMRLTPAHTHVIKMLIFVRVIQY